MKILISSSCGFGLYLVSVLCLLCCITIHLFVSYSALALLVDDVNGIWPIRNLQFHCGWDKQVYSARLVLAPVGW